MTAAKINDMSDAEFAQLCANMKRSAHAGPGCNAMGFVSREDRIHGMLRAVQIEAERNPATALRGRLVCRGFRSGLEAVAEGKPSVAELEQLLRQKYSAPDRCHHPRKTTMIDKRDGTTKRPIRTVDNGFPKSTPERAGGGKGSSGVPSSSARRHEEGY